MSSSRAILLAVLLSFAAPAAAGDDSAAIRSALRVPLYLGLGLVVLGVSLRLVAFLLQKLGVASEPPSTAIDGAPESDSAQGNRR